MQGSDRILLKNQIHIFWATIFAQILQSKVITCSVCCEIMMTNMDWRHCSVCRKKANWDKRSAICSDASSIQCAISWKASYISLFTFSLPILRSHLSSLQISYLAPIRGHLLSFYRRSQTNNEWKWPACVKKRCKFNSVFAGTEAKFPSSLKRKILRRYCL